MGKFRDKVDYAETLRREGIELPAMDDDAPVSEEDDRVNEEEEDAEDIHDGTPVQASTTVANDFEPRAPMGTHGQSQQPMDSHPRQSHEQAMEGATDGAMEAMELATGRATAEEGCITA